MKTLELAF